MSIDGAIDTLIDALGDADIEPPRAPSDLAVLDEIEATIAPLRLPGDVRTFWARVDPSTLNFSVWMMFRSPESSLRLWRSGRDEFPGLWPAMLFTVAAEGWVSVSVELDGPQRRRGQLLQWAVDGGDFRPGYRHLGDWLMHIAALISNGSYERTIWKEGVAFLRVEDEWSEWRDLPADLIGTHPIYGDAMSLPRDPLQWPAHWQRAAGIEEEDLHARGTTHKIADLLASDPAFEVRATIEGEVISVAGGRDTFVRVTDGTDTIDIRCPAEITALGPALRKRFEFDVVVPAGHRVRPADNVFEIQDKEDEPEVLAAKWSEKYPLGPVGVLATAIRPLQ